MAIAFLTIVAKFAAEVVAPKVREMDENEKMDMDIVKGLYGKATVKSSANLRPRSM